MHDSCVVPTNDEVIAAEVRAAVGRQRRTQEQIAQALGIGQPAVSRRLAGAVPFTAAELAQLAEWLDVPIETLLGRVAS